MKFLIFALLIFPISSSAGWFGPSTYDECILDNMKGVNSDSAARFIQHSCRNKFPTILPDEIPEGYQRYVPVKHGTADKKQSN